MKTIGILGALPEEVERIMMGLDGHRVEEYGGATYHFGKRAGRRVVVCHAGMGKANAAAATQVLITKYDVDAIIFSGIAGSMNPEARVGDVVIGQEVFYHDASDELLAQSAPGTAVYTAHPLLVDVLEQACKLTMTQYIVGRIATGDRFIGDVEEKRRIVEQYHPDCVEMEGAAVGQVAMRNKVPFVVLRAMSDECDAELSFSGEDKFDISYYVTTAASIVVAALDALKTFVVDFD